MSIDINLNTQFHCVSCGKIEELIKSMQIIIPIKLENGLGEKLLRPICRKCFEELKNIYKS